MNNKDFVMAIPDETDGDYIVFPSKDSDEFEPYKLCWSTLKTRGSGFIGIGRDNSGSIVAIHIPKEQ